MIKQNRLKLVLLLVMVMIAIIISFAQKPVAVSAIKPVSVFKFEGPVDVPHADFVLRAIDKANRDGSQVVVMQLNTPGGSLDATQQIITKMLSSPIPVVVYVSPQGAWAGSAGVFITMTADVAAMAPSTTIGSAHPVSSTGQDIPKDMRQKLENFTAAWIHGIALRRHRNANWAEQAVRKSVAVSEQQAAKLKVVDFIANDLNDLLVKLDGRQLTLSNGQKVTLHTTNAPIKKIEMTMAELLLTFLVNPYLLIILGTIALYGIIAEVQNPGAVFPGVIGSIALLLVLYGGSFLPINIVGVGLILLSVTLFLVDIYSPTHGVLTVGGLISLFLGLTMLFRSDYGAPEVSIAFILPLTLVIGLTFAFILSAGVRAQFRPKESGAEGMVGRLAEVKVALNPRGQVFMDGTHWNAVGPGDTIPIGQMVRVSDVKGLTLYVEPVLPDGILTGGDENSKQES
ncbi:MAG: nodulation protein NfeD [bacterium]